MSAIGSPSGSPSVPQPRRRVTRPPALGALERLEDRCLLSADAVLEWNAVAIEATKQDNAIGAPRLQIGPTRASRVLAIESAAVFDAVNAIDGSYTPYLVTDVRPAPGASLEAAVAQAAHDTLSAMYPYLQASLFDPTLAADLAVIPAAQASAGRAVGQTVALEILSARANDGAFLDAVNQPVTYVYGNLPGQWRADPLHPTATPLTPDWGKVTPFAVQSATQFGAPPPPSITSKEYADAYQEVKAIGGDGTFTTTTRTSEQTDIGFFWGYDAQPGLCAPVRFYNQIAEVLARQEGNTEVQNARFFGLINLSMADAAITCWNDKFRYDYWRPITAIRENDPGTGPTRLGSGNPYLVGQGDPGWRPAGAPADNGGGTNFTPPFPSYTSGHASIGAALFETMKDFFGTDGIHFTIVSDEFNTITVDQSGQPRPFLPRTFDRFSQAADENAQSRIYLGIHWRFDKVEGIHCGDGIGDYIFTHALRPRSPAAVVSAAQPTLATVSAGGSTIVFSVTPDHALFMHQDATGWTRIGDPGTILGIAAARQANGDVALFDVGTDRAMSCFRLSAGWIVGPLGAAGTIGTISVGQGVDGTADAFVMTTDGSLCEFRTSAGWVASPIGAPGTVLAMSASGVGQVTVIGSDESVLGHDEMLGWFTLAGPGFARALDTTVDVAGLPVVYTVSLTDALYRHEDATGWTRIGGEGTIRSLSAGLDRAGHADVFALTTSADLVTNDAPAGWSILKPPGAVSKLSAAALGQAFAVLVDGSVWETPAAGTFALLASPGFARA